MGDSSADDVADPIGLPRGAYQHMVTELPTFSTGWCGSCGPPGTSG